jgi:hypothetical protein
MCGKTVEVYVEGCETIATDMKAKKKTIRGKEDSEYGIYNQDQFSGHRFFYAQALHTHI